MGIEFQFCKMKRGRLVVQHSKCTYTMNCALKRIKRVKLMYFFATVLEMMFRGFVSPCYIRPTIKHVRK